MFLPLIKSIVHRADIGSTSDLARALINKDVGVPELPLLVRADRQSAGRGRGSNRWWSDLGSLTFTVALDPAAHSLAGEREPRLSLALAVSLIGAFESNGWLVQGAAGIRWPNDIEINERKLAGLLLERLTTTRGPRLLLGVGINVSTGFESAPPDVQSLATSLEREHRDASCKLALDDVLLASIDALRQAIDMLAQDDPGLPTRWNELDRLRERPVRIDLGNRVIRGVGAGIDSQGRLRVATETDVLLLTGGQVLRGVVA